MESSSGVSHNVQKYMICRENKPTAAPAYKVEVVCILSSPQGKGIHKRMKINIIQRWCH